MFLKIKATFPVNPLLFPSTLIWHMNVEQIMGCCSHSSSLYWLLSDTCFTEGLHYKNSGPKFIVPVALCKNTFPCEASPVFFFLNQVGIFEHFWFEIPSLCFYVPCWVAALYLGLLLGRNNINKPAHDCQDKDTYLNSDCWRLILLCISAQNEGCGLCPV